MTSPQTTEIRSNATFKILDVSSLPETLLFQFPPMIIERENLLNFCSSFDLKLLGYDEGQNSLRTVEPALIHHTHVLPTNSVLFVSNDGNELPFGQQDVMTAENNQFSETENQTSTNEKESEDLLQFLPTASSNVCNAPCPEVISPSQLDIGSTGVMLDDPDNSFEIDEFYGQFFNDDEVNAILNDEDTSTSNAIPTNLNDMVSTPPAKQVDSSKQDNFAGGSHTSSLMEVADHSGNPATSNQVARGQKKARPSASKSKILAKLRISPNIFECKTCGIRFEKRASWLNHMSIHTQNKTVFSCQIPGCTQVCARESDLRLHIRNRHDPGTVALLTCDFCKKHFSTFTYARQHKASCSSNPSAIPSTSTTEQRKRRRPMSQVDISTYKFSCTHPGCVLKFPTEGGLQRHAKTHVPQSLSCPFCSKTYQRSQALMEHLSKSHANENGND